MRVPTQSASALNASLNRLSPATSSLRSLAAPIGIEKTVSIGALRPRDGPSFYQPVGQPTGSALVGW